MEPTLKKSPYPWAIVVSALFWSGLVFGLMGNTVGLYYSPVATEMNWDMTQTSFFMTIFPLVAGAFSPIAGRIYQSVKKTQYLLAATALLFALTHLWAATFQHVWQWNLYGVLTGFYGGMLMYIPIPMLINNWFTKQKGLALGLAASFVNIIPAIFNPIITAQIGSHGWRPVRTVVAICVIVVVVPLTLIMVRKYPADKGMEPWGGVADETGKIPFKSGVTAPRALRSVAFWLAIVMVSCIVSTATINQRIASLATAREFEPALVGLAATFIMIGGVLGKYILGFVRDLTKNPVLTGCLCGAFGLIGCILFLTLGTSSAFMFFTSILIYGFGYAGLTVIPPIVVEAAFGGRSFPQIFANVSIATCVASSGASLIYAQIIDRTGGYEGCFYFAIGLYLVFTLTIPFIIKLGQRLERVEDEEPVAVAATAA